MLGAEVVLMGGEGLGPDRPLQHVESLLGDLGADSVATDDGELHHVVRHGRNPTWMVHDVIIRFHELEQRVLPRCSVWP